MLVPAILRREEIIREMQKYYYTDDMMYESGNCTDNWTPSIQDNPQDGLIQYAIVNKDDNVIGFLSYMVDWYSSCAYNFGLMSFDRGNPLVGKDLYYEMKKLLDEYKLHRIDWRMVSGNPVERGYDRFCEKYNGRKLVLKDTFKDRRGNYHDTIIYEILQDN